MLDRLLNMADVPLEAAGLSVQGHWAGQAAANLAASGVLTRTSPPPPPCPSP